MTDSKSSGGRLSWGKEYVVGLGLGTAAVLYGVAGIIMRRIYMPGFTAQDARLTGPSATAMAAAFIAGGLYLLLRLYGEKRLHTQSAKAQVYMAEVALLVAFIGGLLYVLFKVGTVGGG